MDTILERYEQYAYAQRQFFPSSSTASAKSQVSFLNIYSSRDEFHIWFLLYLGS